MIKPATSKVDLYCKLLRVQKMSGNFKKAQHLRTCVTQINPVLVQPPEGYLRQIWSFMQAQVLQLSRTEHEDILCSGMWQCLSIKFSSLSGRAPEKHVRELE